MHWPEQLDPGTAEWSVMSILWTHEALTLAQVEAKLSQSGTWANAADALLSRLLEQGLVRYEDRRRRSLRFVATVTKEQLQDELFRRFLRRHFDGDVNTLLSCIARTSGGDASTSTASSIEFHPALSSAADIDSDET